MVEFLETGSEINFRLFLIDRQAGKPKKITDEYIFVYMVGRYFNIFLIINR